MSDHGGRYGGNGDAYLEYAAAAAGASPPARSSVSDGFGHSRSKYDSHEYKRGSSRSRESERGPSKSRDRERDERDRESGKGSSRSREYERGSSKSREWGREKVRDRDSERHRDGNREGERDRDPHHRDHKERSERTDRDRDGSDNRHHNRDHRERSERSVRGQDGSDDQGRHHRRDHHDRHRDSDRDRGGRLGHRSRSHRSRSRSRSSSKSKRISGFDMAPPASVMTPIAFGTGQAIGATPAFPGFFPNMYHNMTQQATRHARRVYVGGLSPTANEQSVATFFSQVMSAIGGNAAGPGDAVVNVYINHEKKFAFVEMRSVEEASNAMALDGIIFEGAPVKVRRPSDYNPSHAAALGPSQPNPDLNLAAVGLTLGSAGGLEGPDRIFVGGIPYYFTEAQIRELLESFGLLRGFDLVKDRETGNSKGYAFCVYQDLSVTDIACSALNGINMGDKTLTVRRANQGTSQFRPEQESVMMHARQQVAQMLAGSLPTKVVCLTQVVSADDLKNDSEYEDIMEDMRGEGGKYGKLMNVVIPRPGPNGEVAPGVGKVFLEYAGTEGSTNARQGLNGRKFGGSQVVAVFYPEDKYAGGEYGG